MGIETFYIIQCTSLNCSFIFFLVVVGIIVNWITYPFCHYQWISNSLHNAKVSLKSIFHAAWFLKNFIWCNFEDFTHHYGKGCTGTLCWIFHLFALTRFLDIISTWYMNDKEATEEPITKLTCILHYLLYINMHVTIQWSLIRTFFMLWTLCSFIYWFLKRLLK